MCDSSVKIGRVGLNNPRPEALDYDTIIFKDTEGNGESLWWREKDSTHPRGYSALIPLNREYTITFQNMPYVTNITYNLAAYGLYEDGDHIVLTHKFNQIPDALAVKPGQDVRLINTSLPEKPNADNFDGEWYWSTRDMTMSYILAHKKRSVESRGTAEMSFNLGGNYPGQRKAKPNVYRCFFRNCQKPPAPTVPEVVDALPAKYYNYSVDADWEELDMTRPGHGDNFTLPQGIFMVMDVANVTFERVHLEEGAILLFPDDDGIDHHEIWASHIRILGLIQTGFKENYESKLTIHLLGDPLTRDNEDDSGPLMGSKAIGVYGRLDLRGQDVRTPWIKLDQAVNAGDTTLVLAGEVDWKVGDEVFVTSTSFVASEVDVALIQSTSTTDGKTTLVLDTALEYGHRAEKYNNGGKQYTLAAEVGLLTRSIRIEGTEFEGQSNSEFGGRVLVTGEGRFSNVEFKRCGQRGFTSSSDPRFSVAFHSLGDVPTNKSFVRQCAFNYNYNAAIGLIGTNLMDVSDNVVRRAYQDGVIDRGEENAWRRNLVAYVIFEGTHLGSKAASQYFGSCIDVRSAKNVILEGNVAAGCERGGLRTEGQACSADRWSNNEVRGAMHGVKILTLQGHSSGERCVKLNNFLVWQVYDFAFYVATQDDAIVSDSIVADSDVGILPLQFLPAALSHTFRDAVIRVENMLFHGHGDGFDCDGRPPPSHASTPFNMPKSKDVDHAGVAFPVRGSFGGREEPMFWDDLMQYPTMMNRMELDGAIFVNFGNACGKKSYAFRTQQTEEDMQFPIFARNVQYIDTDSAHILLMNRPSLGKVNPSDCVDMPCDGKKKAMIYDLDGSVAADGNPGTIIPFAEWNWDQDRRYGTGDYRLPNSLTTDTDGNKVDVSTFAPNKGIVREGGNCVSHPDWNDAYKCTNINHRLMVIESMDPDTEIRRLSPIAVIIDGYVDLINGPQDHGWCFGYTCQERISTFHTVVALDRMAEVHMTSTPPQTMRYHLLHSEKTDAFLLKVFMLKSMRYDVFSALHDDMSELTYRPPKNAIFREGRYQTDGTGDQFIPDLSSSYEAGDNYFDPVTKMLYIVVTGKTLIEVRTKPVVTLAVGGQVDLSTFFEDDAASNLANLLGIPPSNVRVSKIVRENSRRREATNGTQRVEITYEISKPATADGPANSTGAGEEYASEQSEMNDALGRAASMAMTGSLELPGFESVDDVAATPAEPPREAPQVEITQESAGQVTGETFAEASVRTEQERQVAFTQPAPVQQPEYMFVENEQTLLALNTIREMEVLPVAPKIHLNDDVFDHIVEVGVAGNRWRAGVNVSNDGVDVQGTTEVAFDDDGYATFDDLRITKAGLSIDLVFFIVDQDNTDSLTATLTLPQVHARVFSTKFVSVPRWMKTGVVETSPVTIALWDPALDLHIKDSDASVPSGGVACTLTLEDADAELTGTLQVNIDETSKLMIYTKPVVDPI